MIESRYFKKHMHKAKIIDLLIYNRNIILYLDEMSCYQYVFYFSFVDTVEIWKNYYFNFEYSDKPTYHKLVCSRKKTCYLHVIIIFDTYRKTDYKMINHPHT